MCPILLTRFPVKMRTLFQLDMWKTRPLKSFRVLHIADSNYELSGADRNILPVRHRVATIRIYRAGFPALQKFYVLFIGTKYFFATLLAMEEEFYDVVILSDLHLGSEISRAHDALQLLRSLRFHRLILLGDIFCNLDFRILVFGDIHTSAGSKVDHAKALVGVVGGVEFHLNV